MGQIEPKKVVKRFGESEVIPPLDLTIEDGEFAVFVGPSGCGKSTLLRLIAGLEKPDAGQIRDLLFAASHATETVLNTNLASRC